MKMLNITKEELDHLLSQDRVNAVHVYCNVNQKYIENCEICKRLEEKIDNFYESIK
jgi:hypothetical protein